MPVPPRTPITWVVRNSTPPAWGAVITAFACDYTYSDGDTERVAAPYPIQVVSGATASRKATKTKCVVKCHLAIRIDDQKGPHLFDKYYVEADFLDKCPDLHESTVGPKGTPLTVTFSGVLGDEGVPEYSID